MKVKTSITLSEDVMHSIDKLRGKGENRSVLIEKAVTDYIEKHRQAERNLRDLDIINKRADKLNREVEDVLSYQVDLHETR